MKLKILPSNINHSWTLYDVATKYPPASWEAVFENSKNELKDISDILEEDRPNGRRLPNNEDLFKAFWLTPLPKVKVVILGQDPYPTLLKDGRPQAMGLCFSVPKGAPIPSSLQNIFKELKNTIPTFNKPSHGDLTSWALQGILLLNACLAVRQGEPDSFKNICEGFIKKVILAIIDTNPNCIFVLWGKNAQRAKKFIGQRGIVLEAAHPSGLSASRGFYNCNHYNKINEILTQQGKTPIDWNL